MSVFERTCSNAVNNALSDDVFILSFKSHLPDLVARLDGIDSFRRGRDDPLLCNQACYQVTRGNIESWIRSRITEPTFQKGGEGKGGGGG